MPRFSTVAGFWGLLFALLLGGCSADSSFGAHVFAVQGKFEWQSCKQLVGLRDSYAKQIDDLHVTMAKAAQDAGGGFVNATAHRPTLVGLEAERRLVEESMAKKNCASPPPPRAARARARLH
jgi:hypothetical protein